MPWLGCYIFWWHHLNVESVACYFFFFLWPLKKDCKNLHVARTLVDYFRMNNCKPCYCFNNCFQYFTFINFIKYDTVFTSFSLSFSLHKTRQSLIEAGKFFTTLTVFVPLISTNFFHFLLLALIAEFFFSCLLCIYSRSC